MTLEALQNYIKTNCKSGLQTDLLDLLTMPNTLTLDSLSLAEVGVQIVQRGFDLNNKPENLKKAEKFVKKCIKNYKLIYNQK